MNYSRKILVATSNPGKLSEIKAILAMPGVSLLAPADLGLDMEVAETGATYAENAILKARAFLAAAGLVTLGDDSGLEVDALGGAPGLHSARYAGPAKSDQDRITLLLRRLEGVPEAQRAARFRCVVAVASPDGEVQLAEGSCAGRIALRPAGTNGFGYDPVFYMPDYGCTMAELPDEVKNAVSHRGRALQAARPLLLAALDRQADGRPAAPKE